MNRYVIDGIVRDIVDGKDVALLAARRRDARKVFDLVYAASDDWPEACRVNGREVLRTWNGSLHVLSLGPGGRGLSLDVLVLVDGLRPIENTRRREDILAELIPAGNGRPNGLEIIYCE